MELQGIEKSFEGMQLFPKQMICREEKKALSMGEYLQHLKGELLQLH
jgi:hypothetical protein